MPPISLKKLLIVILVVILLSRLDKVAMLGSRICGYIYESFEPFREFSKEQRYLVMLAFFALLYITIFKLLYKRK